MSAFQLHNYLSEEDYQKLKTKYEEFNNKCKESIIFHVGTGAGLYSEIGSMLECIMYCYTHEIKFTLYADDANFTNGQGWECIFEEFCPMSHHDLNKIANYRYKKYFRIGRVAFPNFLFRRVLLPEFLKKREGVEYLTQDLFDTIISDSFRGSNVKWELFNIDGTVKDEYCKLSSLCLRYTKETYSDIRSLINSVKIPESYVSIQIRGGDKTEEFTDIKDADFCIQKIESCFHEVKSLFVFTDDYRNIEYIKNKRPNWQIYTLTRPEERGYYNNQFNKQSWENKRRDLIKLFAMVEICIHADTHIGCDGACVNLFIKSCKNGKGYEEYQIGKHKPDTFANKIKRIIQI